MTKHPKLTAIESAAATKANRDLHLPSKQTVVIYRRVVARAKIAIVEKWFEIDISLEGLGIEGNAYVTFRKWPDHAWFRSAVELEIKAWIDANWDDIQEAINRKDRDQQDAVNSFYTRGAVSGQNTHS